MNTDIAIIGAGPYGLSVASHTQSISGLRIKIFGKPMSFWERQMPEGMLLRSGWEASHLADPQRGLSLDAYKEQVRNHLSSPVPLDRFVEYGRWFQQTAVPNVDTRNVTSVRTDGTGFSIQLEDGTSVKAKRVIVAAGISAFAWSPPEFDKLPVSLASHSSEHCNLAKFSKKRVTVVGGGQSALESAALLHESGADVCLIVRKPRICWLGWKGRLKKIVLLGNLLYSSTDVGPAGLSHLV